MIERFADRASAHLISDTNRRESQRSVDIHRSMMRLLLDGDVSENTKFHKLCNVFCKLRFSGGNGHISGEIHAACCRRVETHKRAAAKPAIETGSCGALGASARFASEAAPIRNPLRTV